MTTLRRRLFAAVLGAVVLSVALTVAVSAALTRRTADRNDRTSVARRADLLAVSNDKPTYIEEDVRSGAARLIIKRRPKMHAYVDDVDRSSDGRLTLAGKRYLYSYRPIGPRGLIVLRAEDLRAAAWRPFLRDVVLAGLLGSVLAAAISYVLARSIAGPVRRVSDASRALASGSSPDPLPTAGSAELRGLAEAFNDMAAQLAASREAERNFLLSVSHELKTPLTAIRGYAEGLAEGAFDADEAAAPIALEARRLERLVRDLLDLARMNRHEFSVRREPVDLADSAREAVRRHEATARDFGVALAAEGDETWVEADGDRVLQVASNLVENALRETPRGGSVTVRVEPGRLVVADTGPGLAVDDVARAFERFYLYDKHGRDRPVGSGLGLAIVQQLARAMGGEVAVESARGRGAVFSISLRPLPRQATVTATR